MLITKYPLATVSGFSSSFIIPGCFLAFILSIYYSLLFTISCFEEAL